MVTQYTPLQMAARKEQLEIIQYLVKTCTTVDLIGQTDSKYGRNSLHYAAWYSKKNVQMLQWLIDNYNGDIKEIINHQNKYGNTPLDYAYEYNKIPLSKMTLSHCCVNMVEKPIVMIKMEICRKRQRRLERSSCMQKVTAVSLTRVSNRYFHHVEKP